MDTLKKIFTGFKNGIKNFGNIITILINTVLLAFVYFVGVGVSSIFAKLSRKKLLELKLSKQAPTYWSDLGLKKKPLEDYYRQF
ncbi:hypothetical protein HYU06_05325 [Candidatus Woesearchaeota archaeon]|nr:hypothetical protein [Candidatus Woesearchaeota archaeon]